MNIDQQIKVFRGRDGVEPWWWHQAYVFSLTSRWETIRHICNMDDAQRRLRELDTT